VSAHGKKGKRHRDKQRHWTTRALTTGLACVLGAIFVAGMIGLYGRLIGSGHGFTWQKTGTPIAGLASLCTFIVLAPILFALKVVQDSRKKKSTVGRKRETLAAGSDASDSAHRHGNDPDSSDRSA